MVLACNKMDHPAASPHVAALRAAYPLETFVPLSALAELQLVRLRRAGRVRYAAGAPFQCIEVANGADGEAVREVAAVQELIKTSGGAAGATGVLSAINAAVALRY
jgi:ribosome-binding ATPase YchF (GTP1/OBG family)